MESKVYTPEEVLNLQSVAYQKGINEGYKLRKSEQQCAVWVKGVRGFPIKKPVIAKKFISHLNREVVGTASSATGEMICFDWGVSAVCLAISHEELNDLMWLDESAAGRESDVKLFSGLKFRSKAAPLNLYEIVEVFEKSNEFKVKVTQECEVDKAISYEVWSIDGFEKYYNLGVYFKQKEK